MIFCLIFIASMLSLGNAEFDQKAAESSAKISIERFADELCAKGLENGLLEGEMLKNVPKYANLQSARNAGLEFYLEAVDRKIKAECEQLRSRLKLAADCSYLLSDDEVGRLRSGFAKYFTQERRNAIEKQAQSLLCTIRPTEREIDEKKEDELIKQMVGQVIKSNKSAVFEENVLYISKKMVEPVLGSAYAERKRQGEYLMRARSDEVSPAKLRADLIERLKSNISQRSKGADMAKSWGIFPSVASNRLEEAVKKRSMNRLKAAIENVKFDIDVEKVSKTILADQKKHEKFLESEKVFSAIYSNEVVSNALAAVVKDLPQRDRDEYVSFMSEYLGEREIVHAAEKLVRREILPKWKAVRMEMALKMLKSLLPTLEDGTWFPDPQTSDDILSRSDYSKAVLLWRELECTKKLSDATKARFTLEEVNREADKRVAAAFELARNAIAAQNEIVQSSHSQVLSRAKSLKKGFFTRTPKLNDVVSMLTEVTEEKWSQVRIKRLWPEGIMPANAAQQHVELFPSVKDKIELLARKILEEMNEPEEVQTQPAPQKPAENDSGSSDEEAEQEFTISILKTGSGVGIKLIQGENILLERSVKKDFDEFHDAMDEVSKKLGKDLLSLP